MAEQSLVGDVEVGVFGFTWELVNVFQIFGRGLMMENIGLSWSVFCVCGVDMCTNCNADRIAGCGSSLLSRSMFFVGDWALWCSMMMLMCRVDWLVSFRVDFIYVVVMLFVLLLFPQDVTYRGTNLGKVCDLVVDLNVDVEVLQYLYTFVRTRSLERESPARATVISVRRKYLRTGSNIPVLKSSLMMLGWRHLCRATSHCNRMSSISWLGKEGRCQYCNCRCSRHTDTPAS